MDDGYKALQIQYEKIINISKQSILGSMISENSRLRKRDFYLVFMFNSRKNK